MLQLNVSSSKTLGDHQIIRQFVYNATALLCLVKSDMFVGGEVGM